MTETNRVVIAVAPEKKGVTPVDRGGVREALRAGLRATLDARGRTSRPARSCCRQAGAGTITARREIPEIGVTVLTLSNGVEVWLKPTDFSNDQIVVHGVREGRDDANVAGPTIATPR